MLLCSGKFSLHFHFIPSSYDAIPNYIGMDNLIYFYGPDSVCSETWNAPIVIFNFLYFLCLSNSQFFRPLQLNYQFKKYFPVKKYQWKTHLYQFISIMKTFFKIWKILPWLTSLMLHKLIIYLVFPFLFLSYIVVWFLPPFLPCL